MQAPIAAAAAGEHEGFLNVPFKELCPTIFIGSIDSAQEDHLLQLASIKVVLAEDSLKLEHQNENGIVYVNLRAGLTTKALKETILKAMSMAHLSDGCLLLAVEHTAIGDYVQILMEDIEEWGSIIHDHNHEILNS